MGKLIFVLIDGLRRDTAFRHMGFLEHLLEIKAASRYTVRSELPSMSRPLYETLMTGTPVWEHGIYSNEVARLTKEENLFSLAVENGLATAAAAFSWFSELYNKAPFNPVTDRLQLDAARPIQNGIFYFKDVTGNYPNSHLVADAEALRANFNPDFLLVHPMNTDDAGHRAGSDSADYVGSVVMADYVLSNAIPIWVAYGYTVLVTADHGFNRWGVHGGNGDDERLVPLYIVGPAAGGGDWADTVIPQLMIAPLCCDILGIPKGRKMIEAELPGYDAFLIDVTPNERMDYVSSFGYGIGYIGSCVPFVISLGLILFEPFGLDGASAVKTALLLNGVWWLLFSIPFLRNVKQIYYIEKSRHVVRKSLKNVLVTFKKITRNKEMSLFLLSYIFYIDGVHTVITMSAQIGADRGIVSDQLVLALLATQVVAAVSVMVCARLVKATRAKPIILVSVAIFAGVAIFGFFMSTAVHFWIMAMIVALVLGTTQALSRSFFAKLIPEKNHNNEYFGFYSIMTRYASILGPLILGGLTLWTGDSRYGILGIASLFVIGFLIFLKVREPNGTETNASDAVSAEVSENAESAQIRKSPHAVMISPFI